MVLFPIQRAGTSMTYDAWPLRSYLELGALPTVVPCARLHVRHPMWEWGLDGLAEDTELLTTELVTNAVKAMAGRRDSPAVRLRLSGDHARVLIEVWDADQREPIPRDIGADDLSGLKAEGGRGLFLVEALSTRWNWYLTQEPAGKVVWCELVEDWSEGADGSTVQPLLPRRIAGTVQAQPATARHDLDVLRRTRDGLRDL